MNATSKREAFSLVELSIVLVILGLLTGGILAGQSLIRAAELRSISSDIQRYQTAVRTFQDKYMALPGDMRNAVRFWTAQTGATTDGVNAACAALTTAATGQATCNGDGNGQISTTGAALPHEIFRAWQHLANAGLVEGNYSGISGGGVSGYHAVINTNCPASKLSPGGFSFGFYHGIISANADRFDGDYGNVMYFGAQQTDYTLYGGIIKAEEMWNLDTKLDDGKPATGKIVSYKNTVRPNCATSNASTADYDVGNSTANACTVIIKTGF